METGIICKINGPVVSVKGNNSFLMHEMVYVGKQKLIGEVIKILEDSTVVQVYESTTGLTVGEPVASTGSLLSLKLGVGLLGRIYDGILRPLAHLYEQSGSFIERGAMVSSIEEDVLHKVTIHAKVGDKVSGGQIVAETKEGHIAHRIMVPPYVNGTVSYAAKNGEYNVKTPLVKVKTASGAEVDVMAAQLWPIRVPRPIKSRTEESIPLITGQRIIDTLFPLKKGGTAAIPGGFGTGKTVLQHQFAKYADADIIVYVGCGERGNEMTQVLEEFGKLVDPRTNRPLMERTILIANTSNMPVAAREASIYTGITLAEYYRDMGYHVAMMADSSSRWAEALREISGRLEEMPAEEGYPSYLPSRLASFYERAGYCQTLSGSDGSVTIVGAVSPSGNDFSEPVTQNTKRFTRCFFALDKPLAYARHYPSVNWITSYSEYSDDLSPWYENNVNALFMKDRGEMMNILTQEFKLIDIVKLVGSDLLPDNEKLILEVAKVIREGFLQQNSFNKVDTYVPLKKQFLMMDTILYLHKRAGEVLSRSIPISQLKDTGIFEKVIGMKYNTSNEDFSAFMRYKSDIDDAISKLLHENEVD